MKRLTSLENDFPIYRMISVFLILLGVSFIVNILNVLIIDEFEYHNIEILLGTGVLIVTGLIGYFAWQYLRLLLAFIALGLLVFNLTKVTSLSHIEAIAEWIGQMTLGVAFILFVLNCYVYFEKSLFKWENKLINCFSLHWILCLLLLSIVFTSFGLTISWYNLLDEANETNTFIRSSYLENLIIGGVSFIAFLACILNWKVGRWLFVGIFGYIITLAWIGIFSQFNRTGDGDLFSIYGGMRETIGGILAIFIILNKNTYTPQKKAPLYKDPNILDEL